MSNRRHKITISFPREQEHVWKMLEEHFYEVRETNRSAVVIKLLEKALASPATDGEESAGLYELDRLSKQIEEYHERIEELARIVTALGEDADTAEEHDGVTTHKRAKDNRRAAAESRKNSARNQLLDVVQVGAHDNETPKKPATDQRYKRVWSPEKYDWDWVIYEE